MAEGVVGSAAELARKHEEKLRFLVAGVVNTAIGYGCFALMLAIVGASRYSLALTLGWLLSVSFGYANFKLFVFRTRGTNWVAEWARSYLVYGASFLVNLVLLNLFVRLLHLHPLVAQLVCTGLVVGLSFFGHKYFTFGRKHLLEAVDAGEVFESDPAGERAPEE